ncbi:MAG TPA: hypothetical protein VFQ53_28685 [Kofleriaceae bacterium]|nr:hypothetical protein [Kofleriaceae bacterium]
MRGVAVAITLATLLASQSAWGHTFPPVRTVVLQVERCEAVLLVGYRPGSGEATEAVLARSANQPKSRGLDVMRSLLTQQAMAALTISVDGKPLVPTNVRTKLGTEPGGARPMIVLLVTFALPAGKALAISSREPRTTRISWTDRASGRVVLADAPAQNKWYSGMASFLLSLSPLTGGSPCVHSLPSASSDSSRSAP